MVDKFQTAYLRKVEQGVELSERIFIALAAAKAKLPDEQMVAFKAWVLQEEKFKHTGLFICAGANCFMIPNLSFFDGWQRGYCHRCAPEHLKAKVQAKQAYTKRRTYGDLVAQYCGDETEKARAEITVDPIFIGLDGKVKDVPF